MRKDTKDLSLKYIICQTIYKILSSGTKEEFALLVAQRERFIEFFRYVSSNLITSQEREVVYIYQNATNPTNVSTITISSELLLNNIPLERIEYIAAQIPNIWSHLDQKEKNLLFLSSLFTNTLSVRAANVINKTNFDLYLTPQESAGNLSRILLLGANLSEINFSDSRAWFDILLENILNISNCYQDQIKEILKTLVVNNIPIISKNQKLIGEYHEVISVALENRRSQLRENHDQWIRERISSLEQTQVYLSNLEEKNITYDVAEANLDDISSPIQPRNREPRAFVKDNHCLIS